MRNKQLEFSEEEMQQINKQLSKMILDRYQTLKARAPINKTLTREEAEKLIREPLPEQSLNIDDIQKLLDHICQNILGHCMQIDHPRFFAFVPSPANYMSFIADALISSFNVFTSSWLSGSGSTQMEIVVIDWIKELLNYPSTSSGFFTSGGSQANLTALVVAREQKVKGDLSNAVAYFSDQTHSSIKRAFRIIGLKESQLRILPTRPDLTLSKQGLEDIVNQDLQKGLQPFCVVANAGTTNSGAVDPLAELHPFCLSQDIWLHVDGAYGAPASFLKKNKMLFKGLDLCDSISLDPHKWLFTTIECGCLLMREGHLLTKVFSVLPEYLEDITGNDDAINFCDYGIQLTRNARALKLWLTMKVFGTQALFDAIGHGIQIAEYAEHKIKNIKHFELVTPAQLAIVTFRCCTNLEREEANRYHSLLVKKIAREGSAMITTTKIRQETVLRFCTINPRTTEEDIDETLKIISNLM